MPLLLLLLLQVSRLVLQVTAPLQVPATVQLPSSCCA
jgi:hypothetical protein